MIKSSVVVSLGATRFKGVAFQGRIEERFRFLSGLGFNGVELGIRNPREVDYSALIKLVERYKLEVPAIGTGQAFIEEGLCLTTKQARVREQARKRLLSHLELGSKLDAYVIIGLIRGIPEAERKEDAKKILVEELKFLCNRADEIGVRGLLLEPLNRYETSIINSLGEAMSIIEKVGAENLGILADSFHINLEERDIEGSIISAGKRVWHIHLSDSNRHYPGAGHFDFNSLFQALEKIGYEGYISGEFMPEPNEEEAVLGFADFLKKRGLLR